MSARSREELLNGARAALAGVAACALLLVAPSFAGADESSLYQGPGPRPGPDILYEPLHDAPQLQNAGDWSASPILVSGTSAYRGGEFLYQDFLYDDSGALGSPVQNDPRFQGNQFSRPAGTYTYPSNTAVYGNNAADFVELRVKPRPTETAFRITLNTIKDSSVVGATIAIGGTPGLPQAWPFGANVRSPAQYFLTVHGTTTAGSVVADLRDAVTNLPVGATPPTASLDMTRRQITVTVPHSSWDPTGQVVRLAAGVGLWNAATNLYRVPGTNPSATQPGGAGPLPNPPALFNVAFRSDCQQEDPLPPGSVPPGCEPMPNIQSPNAISDPAWWRDKTQAHALQSGDISQFFANVDFNKLAAAVEDETAVPQAGPMNRILASHFETEQGVIFSGSCSNSASTSTNGCLGWLRGRLQPYAIYVPDAPEPAEGYGLTLLLHSLQANYNQFHGSNNQSQFGDRGDCEQPSESDRCGSIVITASGRGPDGWYYGYAASDTFEMWADAAARYRLDPEWTAIAGYSMGGYATYKLATQFPDLFAKGQPTVGPPGMGIWAPPADPQPGGARSNTNRMLASLRNVPFLMWNAAQDELVPVAGAQEQADTFDALGYRYEFDLFNPADHFALAINDEYGPAADFLGTTEVDRDPAHVTYVYNPTMDFVTGQLKADHAYWLSGVTLRNSGGSAPLGTIDVRSHGFGVGDPTPNATVNGAGVLTGGQSAMPFTSQSKTWGAAPSEPVENKLDITATNVSSVTINATRARVACDAELGITSDGPIDVQLVDCPEADLSITKSDSPDPVYSGQELTYTINVANAGPLATGATVTDTLPAGVTLVSATASQGTCSESGGLLTCGLGELASSGLATVTVKVQVQGSARTITNQAGVDGTLPDPDTADNTDSEQTTVKVAACHGREATILGTAAGETLTGTAGDDVIVGLGGNDTIAGGEGNDRICSGAGRDTVAGGEGNDVMSGQSGPDTFNGNGGTDRVSYITRTLGVTVDIDNVADDGNSLDGAGARDNVRTDIESLTGGDGDDALTGSNGNNVIHGELGSDSLFGLGGNDRLHADDGTADAVIDCDGGTADRATVDPLDPATIGCETTTTTP